MLRCDDTICAIATPPGEGGVGIVRVSGPASFQIADLIYRSKSTTSSDYASHTIHYGFITDPATDEALDDALLLVFRSPNSYTGEDVVEFSCHGGPVTLGRVLSLVTRAGARLASPGEFTQRAFLNGKMDLAQAEAVCDQIRARTESAQRLARRQREGSLSREVRRIKDELVGALAAVEVTIDFSEEVGDLDYEAISARLLTILNDLRQLADSAGKGRIYREGIRLAIIGRPNVGKSSLLNALLRQDRAIVTPIAGTTRDIIEESANVRGIPITAIDTAGIRDTDDIIEKIGVDRAHEAMETASLLLFVIDAGEPWTEEDDAIAKKLPDRSCIWVLNKIDLLSFQQCETARVTTKVRARKSDVALISTSTGAGLTELETAVENGVLSGNASEDSIVVSNVRHLNSIESALASLDEASKTVSAMLPADFISIDLRGALDSLGQITGETATEDIIHRIFHDFCIGK